MREMMRKNSFFCLRYFHLSYHLSSDQFDSKSFSINFIFISCDLELGFKKGSEFKTDIFGGSSKK